MDNAVLRRVGRGKVALALPLAGLVVLWVMVILGAYSELFIQYGPGYFNHQLHQQNAFHVVNYLWLIGLAAVGICSVTARRMTYAHRDNRLEHAVSGFALVSVFVSLITATIWGIAIFASNFSQTVYNSAGTPVRPDELMRLVNVYLPILLDAALLVFVILRSFVGLTDSTDDEEAAHD